MAVVNSGQMPERATQGTGSKAVPVDTSGPECLECGAAIPDKGYCSPGCRETMEDVK